MTKMARWVGVGTVLIAWGACEKASKPASPEPDEPVLPLPPGLEERLATVAPVPGAATVDSGRPLVAVTADAIMVEGEIVVAVRDGAVDPAEVTGGALGFRIRRLTDVLAARHRQSTAAPGKVPPLLYFAVDRDTPYRLLAMVLYSASAKGADHSRLGIVARQGDALIALPVELPQHVAAAEAVEIQSDEELPLRPIVAITDKRLILWSLSGQAGTLQDPRLEIARASGDRLAFDMKPLQSSLAELVEQRWKSAARPEDSEEIALMADGRVPVQVVVDVMAVFLGAGSKSPPFPDVLLAMPGFE